MKNLFKLFMVGLLLDFTISSVQATITIDGTPPTVPTSYPGYALINAALLSAFTTALSEANTDLQKYDEQPDLAKGFANANAYAAQAATHQGFQDYTLFAITSGVMVGAQLPSSDPDYYNEIDKKVKKDGDLYAGVAASWSIINAGINAGFLYPGLYLSAKFGYISRDITDEISAKSTLLGIGANYTWFQSRSLLSGFVNWRGISLGTGFFYNRSQVDLKLDLDTIEQQVTAGLPVGDSVDVILDPSVNLGIKSNTFTIPFDVTTSVRLLWVFNFNLGVGLDFNFGSTDIGIKSDGSVNGRINPAIGTPVMADPGSFTVDGGTKNKKPSPVRQRITTGIGLNIAMVKIDVPIIIYPFDSAFAAGVTVGVVF
jgi:hypothetical protein